MVLVHRSKARNSADLAHAVSHWSARAGIRLVPATTADLGDIKRIAARAFPVPAGWTDDPDNTRHYDGVLPFQDRAGPCAACMARDVDADVPLGYVLYQRRATGLYVRELAREPLATPRGAGRLGAALLGAMLLQTPAAEGAARVVAANIALAMQQRATAAATRDAVRALYRYYAGLAFRRGDPARARLANGLPLPPGDVWLEAPEARLAQAIRTCLLSPAAPMRRSTIGHPPASEGNAENIAVDAGAQSQNAPT